MMPILEKKKRHQKHIKAYTYRPCKPKIKIKKRGGGGTGQNGSHRKQSRSKYGTIH